MLRSDHRGPRKKKQLNAKSKYNVGAGDGGGLINFEVFKGKNYFFQSCYVTYFVSFLKP